MIHKTIEKERENKQTISTQSQYCWLQKSPPRAKGLSLKAVKRVKPRNIKKHFIFNRSKLITWSIDGKVADGEGGIFLYVNIVDTE